MTEEVVPQWRKFIWVLIGYIAFVFVMLVCSGDVPIAETRDLLRRAFSTGKSQNGGWIFEYQTLIAGVLAIVGAVITVYAMQRADENARKRHEQLVRLSVHSDTLILHRALVPAVEQLRRAANEILGVPGKSESETMSDAFDRVREDGTRLCVQIGTLISRAYFTASLTLFDGRTHVRLDRLNAIVSILMESFQLQKATEHMWARNPSGFETERERVLAYWLQHLKLFGNEMLLFTDSLERLAGTYGIDCYAEEWVDPALSA